MGRLPLKARAFLLALMGCAVLMLLDAAPFSRAVDQQTLVVCAITGVLVILADTHMIELSHTTKWSVSTALEFALLLIAGSALAIWTLAACALILARWHMTRRAWRWYNVAFYGANVVVSVGVAGLVYQFTAGGVPLLSSPASFMAVVLAGATYFFLDVGNVAAIVSLAKNSDTLSGFLSAFQVAAPQVVGLLALGFVAAVVYTASPIAALVLVVPLIGVYASLKATLALRRETKHALEALAIQVDQYHPYTAEHSDRVAQFAGKIARRLHLADDQVDTITRAARIHDLGKLGIWRDMLNKPAALSAEERAELQTHPARGAELVSRFADYRNGRDLILHHHERYDGRGYPDKLKGEEIPLGARIISVADASDAMLSDRPYRKALSMAETIQELDRNRGKQFDPAVVEVMIAILEAELGTVARPALTRATAAV